MDIKGPGQASAVSVDLNNRGRSATDIPTLFSIASTRAAKYKNAMVDKEQLAAICGLQNARRINEWSDKDSQILKPKRGIRGKTQSVLKFDENEITKAIVATELEKGSWKPKNIASVLELWEEGKLTSVFASPPSTLDQTGRAMTILRARLLSAIMIKLCGISEMPRDCQLIFRKCEAPEAREDRIQLKPITLDVAFSLFQEQNALFGWSSGTDDREINIISRPGEEFNNKLSERNFFRFLVGDETAQEWSEIVIGITADTGNQESRLLKDVLEKGELGLDSASDDYHLVIRCISILQDIVPRMESRSTDHLGQLRTSVINDVQSALLNVILLMGLPRWDFVALLTPNPQKTHLKVIAQAGQPPEDIKDQAFRATGRNEEQDSLAGWVFNNVDDVVIQDIEIDDPRLPNVDNKIFHRGSSIALIPLVVHRNCVGVLLVGAEQENTEVKFDKTDLLSLHLLGRILGESYQRSLLARCDDIFESRPSQEFRMHDEAALKEAITDASKMIPAVMRAGQAHDTYMMLLAISVIGEGVAIPSETNKWLQEKLARSIGAIIKKHGADLWPEESRKSRPFGALFKLQTEEAGYLSLIGFIGRTRIKTDEFRTKLINTVNVLNKMSDNIKLKVLAWSLPFSFNQLSEMSDSVVTLKFDRIADDLIKRVKGALAVLPNVTKGDSLLSKRKFEEALLEYQKAYHTDSKNPYILRHLSDCFVGLERYEEAIDLANTACEIDPVAGSYRRLANAFAVSGKYQEARKAFEAAIRSSPNNAELQHLFAQSLYLEGVETRNSETLLRAVQELAAAKENDTKQPSIQSRYSKYISDVQVQLKETNAAKYWLTKALEENPTDNDLEWTLKLFHHGIILDKMNQGA